MRKQPLVLVPTLACVVLAIALVSTKKENAALRAESAASQKTGERKAAAELLPTSDEAVTAIPIPEEEAPTPEVSAKVVGTTLKNHQRVMSSIANMRENPTMNRMIEASQRGTIGALYADMIEYLNLDAEETKYFMDLLMSRQMANVDFGMKLMSGRMSEDEKNAAADQLRVISNEMKERMKEFLNRDEDYDEFEFYEKTIGERMALSQMDQSLSQSGDPLTDTEYRDLLDMMSREKERFDWSTDLHDQDSVDVSAERFSEENMKQHVTDIHALNELIYQQAMSLLTPEQLEAFKASITATTDMQLSQFEMAGQLLRGQE